MRSSSASRSTSAAALNAILLLAAVSPAAASSFSKSTCLNTRSLEIARQSRCATDAVRLNACLLGLTDGFDHGVLEACFASAGCAAHEAADEASWALRSCEDDGFVVGGDLKKRQNTNTDAAETTAAGNNNNGNGNGNGNGRTTANNAAQTTPAPAAQPTTAQETDNGGVVVVTVTPDDTSAQATADPNAGVTDGPLTCLTTTTVSTTVCPVSTDGPDKGRRGPCVSTTIEFPTCASGLLCRADAQGNPTCMRRIDSLDLGGIIVALVFAVAITTAVAGVCFFCCRERRQQRKLAAKMEAAAIVAASARSKSGNLRSVSANGQTDRTPLIPGQAGGPQEYSDNPFNDQRR